MVAKRENTIVIFYGIQTIIYRLSNFSKAQKLKLRNIVRTDNHKKLSIESTYKTLKNRSEGLYKEKGSKFIGIVQACYSEQEAKNLMALWDKEHHQARHLCYAYRFGVDKKVFRSNDDGEPSNSAGGLFWARYRHLICPMF